MLARQSRFHRLELLFQLGLAASVARSFKGSRPVLKKCSLPLVKQAGVDFVLLAQIGDRFAFQQMQAQNFDFLLATFIPPLTIQ